MRLRQSCESNSSPLEQNKEHLSPMWDILSPLSKSWVKVARARAKKENPDAENDG